MVKHQSLVLEPRVQIIILVKLLTTNKQKRKKERKKERKKQPTTTNKGIVAAPLPEAWCFEIALGLVGTVSQ